MSFSPQISLAEEVINPSWWSLRRNNICTCNQIRVPESEEQSPTLSYSRANSINTAIRKASGDGSNSRQIWSPGRGDEHAT